MTRVDASSRRSRVFALAANLLLAGASIGLVLLLFEVGLRIN